MPLALGSVSTEASLIRVENFQRNLPVRYCAHSCYVACLQSGPLVSKRKHKARFWGGYLSSTASGVFRNRSHEIVGFLVLNDHEYLFKICILIFLNAKMQVRVVN